MPIELLFTASETWTRHHAVDPHDVTKASVLKSRAPNRYVRGHTLDTTTFTTSADASTHCLPYILVNVTPPFEIVANLRSVNHHQGHRAKCEFMSTVPVHAVYNSVSAGALLQAGGLLNWLILASWTNRTRDRNARDKWIYRKFDEVHSTLFT